MPKRSKAQLKKWFERGKYPTEEQFSDWMDSYIHKDEDKVPIANVEGLADLINNKYDKKSGEVLRKDVDNLSEDFDAHVEDFRELEEKVDSITPIKIPVKSYGDDGEVIFENLQVLERLFVDAKNSQKEVVVASGSEMTPASLSYDDYFTSFVLSFFGADKRQHEITFSVEPDGFKIAKQEAFAHSEFVKAKDFSDMADYTEI